MNNPGAAIVGPHGNQPVGAIPLPPVAPSLLPIPPPMPPHRMYQSWYNDDAQDPLAGQYAALMEVMGTTPVNGNLPGHDAVTEAIMSASVMDAQAFVMLMATPAHPRGLVRLYHRVQRYVPRMVPQTPHDNLGYAFEGDVMLGQSPQTVEWPDDAFHQCPGPVRIIDQAGMDQALAANPAAELVGPFAANTAGTRNIRTRMCMLVPFKYIRLVSPATAQPTRGLCPSGGCTIAN